jgi:hypothetical protein
MNILDIVNKALTEHIAAEIATVTEPREQFIKKQDAEITALKSTVTARNATIAMLETENAALKAEIERLKDGTGVPPDDDPTPPPDEEEPPVIVPGDEQAIFYKWSQLKRLPRSGASFDAGLKRARGTWQTPVFIGESASNNAQGDADVQIGAIMAETLDDDPLREKVRAHLRLAATKTSNWLLGLGRQLAGYVEAANLIRFAEPEFVTWVHKMVILKHGSGDRWGGYETILETAHSLNSNWALQCNRSVIAASMYLEQYGTATQKADAARWLRLSVLAYKRFVGEAGDYRELPPFHTAENGWGGSTGLGYGINPEGSVIMIGERRIDASGILQGDWLRAKGTDGREDRDAKNYPPNPVTYHWEGLTPLIVTGAILHEHDIVPFSAGNNAIVRAMKALCGKSDNDPAFNNPPSGDDELCPHVVYHYTGIDFGRQLDNEPDKAGYGWLTWYLGEEA